MDVAYSRGERRAHKRRWLRLPERLPDLKGRWLALYTVVWAIMLPAAVIGSARGTYILLTVPPMWTPYGFATSEDSKGVHVDAVQSPGARATGLKAGDYIVGIDGWPVPKIAGRASARSHVLKPDGSATTFTVRRPSGHQFQAKLTYSRAVDEQSYRDAGVSRTFARLVNFVGVLLQPSIFIAAAILLFVRCRREAVPALLSLTLLTFSSIIIAGDQLGVGAVVLNVVASAGYLFLFAALFAFPSGRFVPRWTAVPFVLLPVTLLISPDSTVVGAIVSVGYALLALAALVGRYRKVVGPERLQLRWAFLGLVVGMLLFLVTLVGGIATTAWQASDPRWVDWSYAFFNPLTGAPLAAMAVGLIVSILRYRLYDADAVIGRSAAYAVLTVGFVALFAASEKLIELLGQEYLGQNVGALAGGVGAAMAAVAIAPMHARIHRLAERRFQKALYRLRHGLPLLVGDLRETSGLEQIAGATLDSLIEGVRASRAALVAGDETIDAREIAAGEVAQWWRQWTPAVHDGIDWDRSDPLFPVRVPLEAEGHGRIGWLLLGARPDGSLFGKAERDAIEEIAEPVARAVQVVMRRQEREAEIDRRFAAIERRLTQLGKVPKPSAA